jgi:peptidoglycan-N-acetylglucosamine deacetylase
VPETVRQVALTFDDGPGPYTAELLSILADRQVAATFFVVGRNVQTRPALVRAAFEQGHEVGNHTYDHLDLTTLTPDAIRQQLDRTTAAVTAVTGARPILARPPYGATNATVAEVLRERDHTEVLWDIDSEDWRDNGAALTTERVLAGAHDGAIVLMHDVFPATVEAVPTIIDALRTHGYTFATVSQLRASGMRPDGARS